MRVTLPNVLYALAHPIRAIRYVRSRDRIPYSVIARYIPAAPVIIEAGAHDGANTLEMAAWWPESIIHAFEPVPEAATLVAERVRGLAGRVSCHACGLGPYDGTIEMHLSGEGSASDCQSSSMLVPTASQREEFPAVHFRRVKTVPVCTLDTWAESEGVPRVDFMWLDMQGFELQALEGASRIVRTTSAIHIEVSNVTLYDGAPLYPEVKTKMATMGFVPVVEAFFRVGGNVLFVRK